MKPIRREAVVPRIDGISRDLEKLQRLALLSLDDYLADERNFDLSQFYLRQILEGIFNIGSHLLSRSDSERGTSYKDVALALGKQGFVDKDYSQSVLVKMAGYRNRLTHFYAQVSPEELHGLINQHLDDVAQFLDYVKAVLNNPEKFGLELDSEI